MLAAGIRIALKVAGPAGDILAEFLTQFVPNQRLDRLQQFVEDLQERLAGCEERFGARLTESTAYAALTEQATVAAVQTASGERRRDLAELVKTGLSKTEVELAEYETLLRLRQQLNDPQILMLMHKANFRGTTPEPDRAAFLKRHDAVFGTRPPDSGSSDDERRRWAIFDHQEHELIALGLLRETEGIVKSGMRRKVAITPLGRILLDAIGRYSPAGTAG